MEGKDARTTTLGLPREGGVGGKVRKPPARRPSATPYARPPAVARQDRNGGWLAKLIDPAYRLISSGATRILPSLFAKSPSDKALSGWNNQDEHEMEENISDDNQRGILNLEISRTNIEDGPTSEKGVSGLKSDLNEHKEGDRVRPSNDIGLFEIEKLIKEKKLTSDEIKRLTEILNSRAASPSSADQKKKSMGVDPDRAERAVLTRGTPIAATENNLEGSNRSMWGMTTPLLQSTTPKVGGNVGASPVEVARAYMESMTSEAGLASTSSISRDERDVQRAGSHVSMSIVPLSSPKPSICWPGAVVQEHHGYSTPHTRRSQFGLHNFPRTPYSRTIGSKSKSQLTRADNSDPRLLGASLTPFQQTKTFTNGQRAGCNVSDEEHASVGPIRRIRQKAVISTPSRGSPALHSSVSRPSPDESNHFEGYLPQTPAGKSRPDQNAASGRGVANFQPTENGSIGTSAGSSTIHPHSSQLARKILEQIDRKRPTLEEKAAELRLATGWKEPSTSEVAAKMMPNEQLSLPPAGGGFGLVKNLNRVDQKFNSEENKHNANSLFNLQAKNTSASTGHDLENACTSASVAENSGPVISNKWPSPDFQNNHTSLSSFLNNQDSLSKRIHQTTLTRFAFSEQKERDEPPPPRNQANGILSKPSFPSSTASDLPNNLNKPYRNKPVLPSISTNWKTNTNSPGFTFPSSASPNVFSDLPTPSVKPPFSINGGQQPATPPYSFGSKRSRNPRLVFSFPSAGDSAGGGGPEIKFSFGSDKKNGVCY